MTKRTPEAGYTNPEVRFERSDIAAGGVVKFGLYLAGGIALVVVSMLWYGTVLREQHRKPDPLDLPKASADDQRPPEPRLEAWEDVGEKKARMFPPRAEEYYAPQVEQLKSGSATILPIESAMEMVAKSSAVRKTGGPR